MAGNTKQLELTFGTEGKRTYTITIDRPPEGLTLETVKTQANRLAKILETRNGVALTTLQKAEIVTQNRETLE